MDELMRRKIEPPPFIRLPVKEYVECSRLMRQNNEALSLLRLSIGKDSSLWTEVSILERAAYKMKCKWKLEQVFRGTRMVLKCMRLLKDQRILETISDALESVIGIDGKLLIPSKQYLEFILVKLIGVCTLSRQAIDYCVYTQTRLLSKMYLGHMLNSCLPFTALISRIWVLCHTLLIQLSKSYTAVFSLHNLANSADYKWLPDGVVLPLSLPIDIKKLIETSTKNANHFSLPEDCVSSEPHRADSKERPPNNENALKKADARTPANLSEESTTLKTYKSDLLGEDVGVIISRKSVKSKLNQALESLSDNSLVQNTKSKKKILKKDRKREIIASGISNDVNERECEKIESLPKKRKMVDGSFSKSDVLVRKVKAGKKKKLKRKVMQLTENGDESDAHMYPNNVSCKSTQKKKKERSGFLSAAYEEENESGIVEFPNTESFKSSQKKKKKRKDIECKNAMRLTGSMDDNESGVIELQNAEPLKPTRKKKKKKKRKDVLSAEMPKISENRKVRRTHTESKGDDQIIKRNGSLVIKTARYLKTTMKKTKKKAKRINKLLISL